MNNVSKLYDNLNSPKLSLVNDIYEDLINLFRIHLQNMSRKFTFIN